MAHHDAVGQHADSGIGFARAVERWLLDVGDVVHAAADRRAEAQVVERVAAGQQVQRQRRRRSREVDGDQQFFALMAHVARRVDQFDAQRMRTFGREPGHQRQRIEVQGQHEFTTGRNRAVGDHRIAVLDHVIFARIARDPHIDDPGSLRRTADGDVVELRPAGIVGVHQIDGRPLRAKTVDGDGDRVIETAGGDIARQILDFGSDRILAVHQRFDRDLPVALGSRHALAHQDAVGIDAHQGIRLGRAHERRLADRRQSIAYRARIAVRSQGRIGDRGRSRRIDRHDQLLRLMAAVARRVGRLGAQQVRPFRQR